MTIHQVTQIAITSLWLEQAKSLTHLGTVSEFSNEYLTYSGRNKDSYFQSQIQMYSQTITFWIVRDRD